MRFTRPGVSKQQGRTWLIVVQWHGERHQIPETHRCRSLLCNQQLSPAISFPNIVIPSDPLQALCQNCTWGCSETDLWRTSYSTTTSWCRSTQEVCRLQPTTAHSWSTDTSMHIVSQSSEWLRVAGGRGSTGPPCLPGNPASLPCQHVRVSSTPVNTWLLGAKSATSQKIRYIQLKPSEARLE